jgi:cytochrome c oxidase subunit 3
MGLPLNNGKVAMWLFLVTEIMFFTGLIGTYIVLRNGSRWWPTPHAVHLVEWMGALNTFVLIISSLTVVLAHSAIAKGDVKTTMYYMVITLALGGVFLGIKAVEYGAKFEHKILPGQIEFDRYTLDGPHGALAWRMHLQEQLKKVLDPNTSPLEADARIDVQQIADEAKKQSEAAGNAEAVKKLSEQVEHVVHKYPKLEGKLDYIIPQGNIWASCYFIMTGFHAIHVLGGLVVFIIILILGALGRIGKHSESMIELTGLYWHFVDIVWIFLFPLLYLV